MVHPYNGILFSSKKKCTIKLKKTRKNLKRILLSERSPSEKDTILYDSTYMTFWKRQNYGGVKNSGCQGLEEGGKGRDE